MPAPLPSQNAGTARGGMTGTPFPSKAGGRGQSSRPRSGSSPAARPPPAPYPGSPTPPPGCGLRNRPAREAVPARIHRLLSSPPSPPRPRPGQLLPGRVFQPHPPQRSAAPQDASPAPPLPGPAYLPRRRKGLPAAELPAPRQGERRAAGDIAGKWEPGGRNKDGHWECGSRAGTSIQPQPSRLEDPHRAPRLQFG